MSTHDAGPLSRETLIHQLREAGRAMSDAAVLFHTRAAECFGLGVSDWKAIGLIEKWGPMTHRQLVDMIGLKPASVTNILDRLEKQEWILRTKAKDDARRISISANREKLSTFREQVFGSLSEKLGTIYAEFSDEELALIVKALENIARAQAVAAEELRVPLASLTR